MGILNMGDFAFYGDESYGQEDAYAVAGYVASVGQWKKFNQEWEKFAKEEGFTILHKRLLEHNVKGSEFEWPELTKSERDEKKLRINRRACRIISDHVLAGIGFIVQKSEWERSVSSSEGTWQDYIGRSFYGVGVFGCVTTMEDVFKAKRRIGMVQYVLENKKGDGRGEAERILGDLMANPFARQKFYIAGYSFENKDSPALIPLQAADFLAYESYRQIDNQVLNRGVKPDKQGGFRLIKPRGAMRCLLRADDPRYQNVHPEKLPVPYFGGWLDATTIKAMTAHMTNIHKQFGRESASDSEIKL
jgi:hypothetical protein